MWSAIRSSLHARCSLKVPWPETSALSSNPPTCLVNSLKINSNTTSMPLFLMFMSAIPKEKTNWLDPVPGCRGRSAQRYEARRWWMKVFFYMGFCWDMKVGQSVDIFVVEFFYFLMQVVVLSPKLWLSCHRSYSRDQRWTNVMMLLGLEEKKMVVFMSFKIADRLSLRGIPTNMCSPQQVSALLYMINRLPFLLFWGKW